MREWSSAGLFECRSVGAQCRHELAMGVRRGCTRLIRTEIEDKERSTATEDKGPPAVAMGYSSASGDTVVIASRSGEVGGCIVCS